jgi:hypothetical protein
MEVHFSEVQLPEELEKFLEGASSAQRLKILQIINPDKMRSILGQFVNAASEAEEQEECSQAFATLIKYGWVVPEPLKLSVYRRNERPSLFTPEFVTEFLKMVAPILQERFGVLINNQDQEESTTTPENIQVVDLNYPFGTDTAEPKPVVQAS